MRRWSRSNTGVFFLCASYAILERIAHELTARQCILMMMMGITYDGNTLLVHCMVPIECAHMNHQPSTYTFSLPVFFCVRTWLGVCAELDDVQRDSEWMEHCWLWTSIVNGSAAWNGCKSGKSETNPL